MALPRYFIERPGANGPRYYWHPGKHLRADGWQSARLPDDRTDAIAAAREINARLDRWRTAGRSPADIALGPRHPEHRYGEANRLAFAGLDLPAPVLRGGKGRGVYLMVRCDGLVKIGVALDPVERMLQLERAQPNRLRLLRFYAVAGADQLERLLHRALAHAQVKGEWFNLDAKAACEVLDRVAGTLADLAANSAGTNCATVQRIEKVAQ